MKFGRRGFAPPALKIVGRLSLARPKGGFACGKLFTFIFLFAKIKNSINCKFRNNNFSQNFMFKKAILSTLCVWVLVSLFFSFWIVRHGVDGGRRGIDVEGYTLLEIGNEITDIGLMRWVWLNLSGSFYFLFHFSLIPFIITGFYFGLRKNSFGPLLLFAFFPSLILFGLIGLLDVPGGGFIIPYCFLLFLYYLFFPYITFFVLLRKGERFFFRGIGIFLLFFIIGFIGFGKYALANYEEKKVQAQNIEKSILEPLKAKAIETADVKLCEELNNEIEKTEYWMWGWDWNEKYFYSCIEEIAVKLGDKSLCEEIWNIRRLSFGRVDDCEKKVLDIKTEIKGKITDHRGNPVKNVRIDFGEKTTTRGCTGSEYTDANGNYVINECYPTKLIEGNYWLAIFPPFKLNLKSESKEVNLKKDETKILNITLKQCGSITGKITDKEGSPLTEAWVYEIGFETPRTHVCEIPEECELGTFVIPYLDPGNYRIGAEVKIGEKYIEISPKEAKVELGKTTVVNFVFEK